MPRYTLKNIWHVLNWPYLYDIRVCNPAREYRLYNRQQVFHHDKHLKIQTDHESHHNALVDRIHETKQQNIVINQYKTFTEKNFTCQATP